MKIEERQDLPALLCAARDGNGPAFNTLLTQYTPLIEHQLAAIRARGGITAEDEQDLRQEATVAFYRATQSYDPARTEVRFGLYAKICVENALISALRRQGPAPLPLEDETLSALAADRGDDPTARLREQEDYEALWRLITRTLSPYESNIWGRYMAGATVPTIAAALGRDVRSVHNAIYRIRHKLRAVMQEKREEG